MSHPVAEKVHTEEATFDSSGEYRRWKELQLLERGGVIRGLSRQLTVPLLVNGIRVSHLRVDFAYFEDQSRVYEDYKGLQSDDWALRWKLAKAIFPNIEWRISGPNKKRNRKGRKS